MSRVWFAQALETVATYWRVLRRDGVTIGLVTHDRDVWFEGVRHRAAPGMVPSAIRRTAGFDADSAEVDGALTDDAIAAADLAAGRFDGARVIIGLVDWASLDHHELYRGALGSVSEEAGSFTAQLLSRKAELARDPVPRTSPTCRAEFCGPGCTLSAARFTHLATVTASDGEANTVTLAVEVAPAALTGGFLRWLDGPEVGRTFAILAETDTGALELALPLDRLPPPGARVMVREGCDRTLDTCATRFANAVNFQGEPFLPGNDLVTRYPSPVQ